METWTQQMPEALAGGYEWDMNDNQKGVSGCLSHDEVLVKFPLPRLGQEVVAFKKRKKNIYKENRALDVLIRK